MRKPMWCNGCALAQNAIDVGSSPTLGTVFLISVMPGTLVAVTMILSKLCFAWLVKLPCVCMCMVIVNVSIKRITIQGGHV